MIQYSNRCLFGTQNIQKRIGVVLMTFALVFCSCIQQKQNTEGIEEIHTPKIVSFLSNFIEKNPNWNQNDIISKQIRDSLEVLLSEKLNDGLLDSIPMELSEVNEYESGKYAVNFQHWVDTEIYQKDSSEFELNFNVIGLVNDSLVNNIQQKSKYYISGNFIEFLGRNFSNYINGSVYTPLIEIEKPYSDRYEISLGIMLFEINRIDLAK